MTVLNTLLFTDDQVLLSESNTHFAQYYKTI